MHLSHPATPALSIPKRFAKLQERMLQKDLVAHCIYRQTTRVGSTDQDRADFDEPAEYGIGMVPEGPALDG